MQKWRPRAENSACGIGLEDGVSTLMDVGFADDRLIIVCLEDPQPHHRGWQQTAVIQVHRRFRTELQATLDPAGRAMLESQSGPFASRVFTTVPYTADFAYPSHLFRVLLLRRLRLPLPLTARACRCRRALDPLGDHRAACPRSGALRSRGTPLERAACREAGARVATHTLISDLSIPPSIASTTDVSKS